VKQNKAAIITIRLTLMGYNKSPLCFSVIRPPARRYGTWMWSSYCVSLDAPHHSSLFRKLLLLVSLTHKHMQNLLRSFCFRASSVLQRNTKLYGPMNALAVGSDGGSSSWNSEGNQSEPTSLSLQFGRRVCPVAIKWQFQAGFSAESCTVLATTTTTAAGADSSINATATIVLDELELEDAHEVQTCTLASSKGSNAAMMPVSGLKLVLNDFTDFYGRVILYRLEVWGYEYGDHDDNKK
jgi:hypothetical protein